jgi:hypothetical protein
MESPVSQNMRETVRSRVAREMKHNRLINDDLRDLTDSLIMLIHHEMTRDENSSSTTTIREFSEMINDGVEEETIHEYVWLKQHLRAGENTKTNVMMLRGLHRPKRNRERMDPNDPASVQRNAVLLQSIITLRKSAYEQLLDKALVYKDFGTGLEYDHSFRNGECLDLLLDHPEHAETLINAMLERGYRDGIDVFRDMLKINVPALNNGAL